MAHYIYIIKNIVTGMYYIGVRSCEGKPDIGIKYFSSSSDKAFMQDQKDNPQNYTYEVIETFPNRGLADVAEMNEHKKLNVRYDEMSYNRYNALESPRQEFAHSDETKLKISIALSNPSEETRQKHREIALNRPPPSAETRKKMSVSRLKRPPYSAETREKIGKIHRGKVVSEETRQKLREIALNRPPMSDETREKISKAGMNRPCSVETREKISKIHKGKVVSEETRQKMRENALNQNRKQVTCPHCGKSGGGLSMSKWHFNNCTIVAGKRPHIPQRIVTCPYCDKKGGFANMNRYHFNNCKKKPK
jgi:hypothetical protein